MDKEIVIGGEAIINAELEGETIIDKKLDGEFGEYYAIAPVPPVPPTPEPTDLVIKDVMFMDYDGAVVASYDAADFIANVTSLPTPPSHDGLTFQEWNWDLADIKTELQTGSGACCIGAHYTTNDGKSHFYIDLKQEDGYTGVSLCIYRNSGTIVIDWGDGNDTTYTSGTTLYIKHVYDSYGEYVISVEGKVKITNGQMCLRPWRQNASTGSWYNIPNRFVKRIELGVDTVIAGESNNLFAQCPNLESVSTHKDYLGTTAPTNLRWTTMFHSCVNLKFFVFPKVMSNVDTSSYSGQPLSEAFRYCPKLITVSFPKRFGFLGNTFMASGIQFLYYPYIPTLKTIGTYIGLDSSFNLRRLVMKFDAVSTNYARGVSYTMLRYCTSLQSVSFEQMAMPELGGYMCHQCYNFEGNDGVVTLHSSVTTLKNDAFAYLYGARKYVFNGAVTKIEASAFYGCYGCMEWDFTHCTTVPTLDNANAFTGIVPEAKIKVPAVLESSWKTAANWSTYASYIVGV